MDCSDGWDWPNNEGSDSGLLPSGATGQVELGRAAGKGEAGRAQVGDAHGDVVELLEPLGLTGDDQLQQFGGVVHVLHVDHDGIGARPGSAAWQVGPLQVNPLQSMVPDPHRHHRRHHHYR